MDDPIHKKLDEIHREVREGNESLHVRHDNQDAAIEHGHRKLDTIKRMLVAAFHLDAKGFLEAWRGR